MLEAAQEAGVVIPTLCHLRGHPALTSCMVCVVRVNGGPRLLPACATVVTDGMVVESETDDIRAARRTALELLLSDHLGDCLGPCQSACPAHMDIPLMIRQIAAGNHRDALITVKQSIALPAVLGRICPEICERACRRGRRGGPVAICRLKQFVADVDLASPRPFLPELLPATGKQVAIIGAGPAGLAAAYYLLQLGHACTLFDEHPLPGGMLRYGVPPDRLPHDVLDAEIGLITRLGAVIHAGARVGREITLTDLRRDFDAVLVAAGESTEEMAAALGLPLTGKGIAAHKHTHETVLPGVFACGAVVAPSRKAVRAAAGGRAAAHAIDACLLGRHLPDDDHLYTVHMGKLDETELDLLMTGASPAERALPGDAGLAEAAAIDEARRCLHCDCRKLAGCQLRRHAMACGARTGAYHGERRRFTWDDRHPDVIYEPGKCIACGICVRLAEAAREPLGLTFIGRGFAIRVAVPFNESLAAGLREVAAQCVAACPTGALAWKA